MNRSNNESCRGQPRGSRVFFQDPWDFLTCIRQQEPTIMNRKPIFVAGALLIAWLAESAVQAHQLGCWIQADRNVKIRNAAGTQASAAINDWNSMTILNISLVSSGEEIFVS